MKKLREMGAFRPELTPNNRYTTSGRMSPIGDADSIFSRRSQMISSAVDNRDNLLYDEESDNESLNEGVALEMIQRFLIDLMLAGVDITSTQTAGVLLLPPRLITNMYQLHQSNKKVGRILERGIVDDKDRKDLDGLRRALGRDIIDLLSALIAIAPGGGIENAVDIIASQLSNPASKFIASVAIRALESIPSKTIQKLIYFGSLPFGGPIVIDALKYIEMIDSGKVNVYINPYHQNRSETSQDNDIIDITPGREDNDIDDISLEDILADNEDVILSQINSDLADDETVLIPRNPNAKKRFNPGNDSSGIKECVTRKSGRLSLLETLKKLEEYEDYSDNFEAQIKKMSSATRDRINDIDEMFSGGVPGVQVPMGYTSKGKPETKKQQKERQDFNRRKSYPYK